MVPFKDTNLVFYDMSEVGVCVCMQAGACAIAESFCY